MNHSTTVNVTVIDPVCGMNIDPAKAVGSSTYEGESYHFCSHGCESKFDAAPAQYANPTASSPKSASARAIPATEALITGGVMTNEHQHAKPRAGSEPTGKIVAARKLQKNSTASSGMEAVIVSRALAGARSRRSPQG